MTSKTTLNGRSVPAITLSPSEFAALGAGEVAYVKPMRSEDFRRAFPESPDLPPGLQIYALVAADGSPILITDERETAFENAAEQELVTVSLH